MAYHYSFQHRYIKCMFMQAVKTSILLFGNEIYGLIGGFICLFAQKV